MRHVDPEAEIRERYWPLHWVARYGLTSLLDPGGIPVWCKENSATR
jgi:hypothetical protein